MTKNTFPYIAAILGIILAITVFKGSSLKDDGKTVVPLLTLLIVSEFGAIISAIGAYLGAKVLITTKNFTALSAVSILCALLCVQFVVRGLQLWPS